MNIDIQNVDIYVYPQSFTIMYMGSPISLSCRLQIIDSYVAGEPTRVVVTGGADLGMGDLQNRLRLLRKQHNGLLEKGKPQPGACWRREDIFGAVCIGSEEPEASDTGSLVPQKKVVLSTATGRVWITVESALLFHPSGSFQGEIAL